MQGGAEPVCSRYAYAKQYAAALHMLNSVYSDTPYAILAECVCRYAAYVGMHE
jgi:hypothetical protein